MIELQLVATGVSPELFISQRPIELVSSIPAVNYGSGPNPPGNRIAHVYLPGCKSGDVLDIDAAFEVTNDLNTNVELVWWLVLSSSFTGVSGEQITFPKGYNVTANMHHGMAIDSNKFSVPLNGDYWIVVSAYAGGPGGNITVEQNAGHMSVTRYRNS